MNSPHRNIQGSRRALLACVFMIGLSLLLLTDSPSDSSDTTITDQESCNLSDECLTIAVATSSSCQHGLNPITGRCRSCADKTHFRSNGKCVHKTVNHPGDPPCSSGEAYYSSYGCRQVECPLGPPHGDEVRDSNGYCLPPSPPGIPRSVSVTPGLGSLTVKWAQPSSAGTSPISGWDVHYSYREISGTVTNTYNKIRQVFDEDIPAGGVIITGLQYGTTYQVRVSASGPPAI